MTGPGSISAPGLGRAMTRLSGRLLAGHDIVDLLGDLAATCVSVVGGWAAGVLLTNQRGGLEIIAASSEQPQLLGVFEAQLMSGPAMDAYRQGRTVVLSVEGRSRWPELGERLRTLGMGPVVALPLRFRTEAIGAMVVILPANVGYAAEDVRIAQALADVATIAVLNHRTIQASEDLADQLRAAIDGRIAIEQAKGIVAQHFGIDIDSAFVRLRGFARRNGIGLTALAGEIVDRSRAVAALVDD